MPDDAIERLEKKVDGFVMAQRNKTDTVWRLAGAGAIVFVVGTIFGAILKSSL